jgi:hypothetical protein
MHEAWHAPVCGYDVAVFLEDLPDRWALVERLASLHPDFLDADAFMRGSSIR